MIETAPGPRIVPGASTTDSEFLRREEVSALDPAETGRNNGYVEGRGLIA
jgi:hypothetical protein